MRCFGQTLLSVIVRHGAVIATEQLILSRLDDLVFRHLENTQMEICWGGERSTCYDDQRDLRLVVHTSGESMFWEAILILRAE